MNTSFCSPSVFDGWENYPVNLSPLFPNDDLEHYRRRLSNEAHRLFSDSRCDFRIATLSEDLTNGRKPFEDRVTDETAIEDVLMKHMKARGDHFIYLTQPYTWASFKLTESAFRKIFTAAKVRPCFLDVVNSFGHPKAGQQDDFFTHCDSSFNGSTVRTEDSDSSLFEFFYGINYMAKTGRNTWPWSNRKMGIYHKYDRASQSSTWIVLQPTIIASKLPKLFTDRAKSPVIEPHLVLFHSTARSWTAYLKYIETEVRKNSCNARMDASTECRTEATNASIAFRNVQSLQYQCDLIYDAISALQTNIGVLRGLKAILKNTNRCWFNCGKVGCDCQPGDDGLQFCISRLCSCLRRAEGLLDQAKQVSNLTSLLLSHRHTQAITVNTTRIEQMANALQYDEQILLELTKATKRDSSVMKIMTVIMTIYLPGTFAATLFSTGFINSYITNSGPNPPHSSFVQTYAFLAITGGLTVITILVGLVWDRKVRLREEAELKKFKKNHLSSQISSETQPRLIN